MSSSATTATLLADPVLAPFLAPSFSLTSYLNTTLPPLAQSSLNLPTQSKPDPKVQLQQQLSQGAHSSNNPNAVPLSQLHPKVTSLLSVLDIHTHRLIAHLQSLTDEILRVAPRLGYEVEVLQGGVMTLAEDLERMQNVSTSGESQLDSVDKPEVLERLEALSTVRARLEEVIAIFGEAMNWPLPEASSDNMDRKLDNTSLGVQSPSFYNLSPAPSPPPFIKRMNEASSAAKAGTKTINPAAEVSYLLASNMVPEARARIEELKLLASVFDGTVEEEARKELIEELEKRVKEAERIKDIKEKGFSNVDERMMIPRRGEDTARGESEWDAGKARAEQRDGEATVSSLGVGRDRYYGLINQLQRMRGMG